MSAAVVTHGPTCACTRCTGFQPGNDLGHKVAGEPGNELAVSHGAYGSHRLRDLALQRSNELQANMPVDHHADEAALRLAGLLIARVELVHEWLRENGLMRPNADPQPILRQLSVWENSLSRLLEQLGCTPRGRVGLDLSQARVLAAANESARRSTDLSRLSDEEVIALRELLQKAEGRV